MKKRVKVIKLILEERMVSLRALEGAESVAAQAIGPPPYTHPKRLCTLQSESQFGRC
jgi:hypothetical protein